VDLDRIDVDRLADVRLWLTRFRGFGYSTASSTPEAPRERAMLELTREASREECVAIGAALVRDLAEEFADAVQVDPSVFHNEGRSIRRWQAFSLRFTLANRLTLTPCWPRCRRARRPVLRHPTRRPMS
jgi:hypothetical protein